MSAPVNLPLSLAVALAGLVLLLDAWRGRGR